MKIELNLNSIELTVLQSDIEYQIRKQKDLLEHKYIENPYMLNIYKDIHNKIIEQIHIINGITNNAK